MTGLIGKDEYVEMDLVKVNNNGKISYYAVVPDTADNMLGVDYSRMNTPRNISTEYLGPIQVQERE